MENCLFCKIIKGELPSKKIYEDKYVYAFEDISPQAQEHVLVVSKVHVKDIEEATKNLDSESLVGLLKACVKVAEKKDLKKDGYRVVTNIGEHGCQSVPHFHIHVLGGNQLGGNFG